MSHKIWVGVDVGAVSAKAVLYTASGIKRLACRRLHGRPIHIAKELLKEIEKEYGAPDAIVVTGSAGKVVAREIGAFYINEFQAITLAVRFLYPEARTILEIGGQTSKYILMDHRGIVDYGINGDCAAGTGSFIDQQAARLHYNIEDVGDIVVRAEKSAKIAGRCSVFAKSDMIHAQQMGYKPEEVLSGLCRAVARNFKAAIIKGRKIVHPAVFIGGVAENRGMVQALRGTFNLEKDELIVPDQPEYIGAVGSALHAGSLKGASHMRKDDAASMASEFASVAEPLSTEKVTFLRDMVQEYKWDAKGGRTPVYLGVDIGSVSTNVVVMDKEGRLIYDIYTATRARPIEVVTEALSDVKVKFGAMIDVVGVGTTGSGRELIGELIGADVVRDEITAHKTGALHIARTMTGGTVDTIFEIGGQDAKFISIENGVVVDFTMNEACAAGTGSFLEEQAEKLGISIKGEFAELALSSKKPLKLGERCTVFMERDIDGFKAMGACVPDIVAGLSYSVVQNYLNRVVRGRKIGENIFFQGGTAYNDAVAAAFANVLEKKIVVPPYNGVIGAVGAALLARDSASSGKFKGLDIDRVKYGIREFTCKACTNECEVQEFTVDGVKTYWGDKCSSRYRRKVKVKRLPVLSDLIAERGKLLLAPPLPLEAVSEGALSSRGGRRPTWRSSKFKVLSGLLPPRSARGRNDKAGSATASIEAKSSLGSLGIPRAMYFYDRFPFWNAYLSGIGFEVALSPETNKKIVEAGITSRVSEPCHPIGVAHGHVQDLLDKGVDYIWLPNILTGEPNGQTHVRPYFCPWGMTLPYVVTSSPAFESMKPKFLTPTLHHLHGPEFLSNQLYKQVAKGFGVKRRVHNAAFESAISAQCAFRKGIETLGEMALHKLSSRGKEAVVLVGRPYNLFDLHINLNVPTKLRNVYGVDVIPMDMLPVPETDITDVAGHMFWSYGKKILAAAKFIRDRENLHMIYITNFKCGPDSFVKHFSKNACAKPFLTLQFDEHSNDAGIMTRIEAYLDSKGLLAVSSARTEKNIQFKRSEIEYGRVT